MTVMLQLQDHNILHCNILHAPRLTLLDHCLVDLVVKASTSRAEDPGFESYQ